MMEKRIYGHRARIGYTSVAFMTEVFAYEFYKIVPVGVSLALLTMQQDGFGAEHIDDIYEASLKAARDMARAGVDMVVLGGNPVNISRGVDNVKTVIEGLEKETGIPISTSTTARVNAYRALGVTKIATVHPFGEAQNAMYEEYLPKLGTVSVGCRAGGSNLVDLGSLPASAALDWGREAAKAYGQADCLHFPCPHWAVAEAIEPLERECGIDVVTSLQAIVWEALRKCGITEPIEGYGRLLREF